ncbi:hypothetical protein BD779DRAFT_1672686 [Infundibulicybe gibba]|nr:hypothetical protein BD779DRAFT_1672686 [Infundibulicybe gibba]
MFFDNPFTLWTYTGRALVWFDDTYSHSPDMTYHISICLQDIAKDGIQPDPRFQRQLAISSVDKVPLRYGTTAIKSFFNSYFTLGVSRVDRSIIAARYSVWSGPRMMTFDQNFNVMKRLIHTSNFYDQIPPFELLGMLFDQLSDQASGRPELEELMQEMIWQRVILFWGLLSAGQLEDPARIPIEVRNVCENLGIFTDEDLDFIFNELHTWINRHPQDVNIPTRCWAVLTSRLEFHEPDSALRHRPPIRDFMAFLDSRFQLGEGVRYVCSQWHRDEVEFDSFLTALYAWIEQNPQGAQVFIHCRELLPSSNDWRLGRVHQHQSFRDFEIFLEAQIARGKDVVGQGPVQNL